MLQDKSSYVEQRAFFLSYFFHAQMTDTIADGNFCARCLCGHIDCPIEHNFSYVVDAPTEWSNCTHYLLGIITLFMKFFKPKS